MARPRTPQPPQGFIASAVNLPAVSRNMAGRYEGWQGDAWNYWETIGELRYPSTWIGNVMSRARLVAARRQGNEIVPVESGPAAEAMDEFCGGVQGQADALQKLGTHLTVAGEAYVVCTIDRNEANWTILAAGKVRTKGSGRNTVVEADFGLETDPRRLNIAKGELALRIWTPQPRDPTRPDSPVRANLTTLAQIRGYDQHVEAQLTSRLAGAGILFLASEMEFAAPPDADPEANQASSFMQVLAKAMMTPIVDRSNPAAVVPIVVTVPGEYLDKAHLMHFWSDLDEKVIEMRDAAIKRLALGLDVPPEVLLGIADANHWNAWLSEESAVKAHLEPRLGVVAHACTTGWLRPAIEGDVPNPEEYYVLADTASIRLRPNRSQEALELYDRGLLNEAATRRETGFQETDKPDEVEWRRWILRKLSTGSTTPEQTIAALRELGIELRLDGVEMPAVNSGIPDHIRTDTVPEIERRDPPEPPELRELVAACEMLVHRALERAGNRLRNSHPLSDAKAMAASSVYRVLDGDHDKLLEGAWREAPSLLASYCDDVQSVIDVLDFYTRGLLSSRREPSRHVLKTLLATRSETVTLEAVS